METDALVKTLHRYLWRELARVAGLALVALTFIMTVLVVIEPLRKRGLAGSQVLALFAYTLPVTFSLTLPIAALFAATIVYGRFSQDNELLACRASGISTVSLLRPAMLLGAIVTVTSLFLSNYVAPHIAAAGEKAVLRNVRGIFQHQLKTRGYVRFGADERYIIHADHINSRKNELELRGFIISDTLDPNDMPLTVASTAFVRFGEYEGETYASVFLVDPAGIRTSQRRVVRAATLPLNSLRLPNITRTKAAFFDIGRLLSLVNKPEMHPDIQQRLVRIQRQIRHTMLSRDIQAAVMSGKPYLKLRSGKVSYVLRAARAEVDDRGWAKLFSGKDPDGRDLPVEVRVFVDGRLDRTVTSATGRVKVNWSALSDVSMATIVMDGPVWGRMAEQDVSERTRRGQWTSGQIAIPEDISAKADAISRRDIYERAEEFITDINILAQVEYLKTKRIPKLLGKIVAEIHGRLAYGVSCCLMVAMGAALGIVFRGGQVITAFALSVVPAALVIVMILMGKELVVNPPEASGGYGWGLAAMWGGNVALLTANVLVYVRLMKR